LNTGVLGFGEKIWTGSIDLGAILGLADKNLKLWAKLLWGSDKN
jgi:hypothetical protein